MIAQLFPRREHHIKDSFDFKQKIDAVSLRDNDVMVSMDIVSMYTSIPTELVISLIVSRSHLFKEKYGLAPNDLLNILQFILIDCAVFQFDGTPYQQNKGLPMGGAISPIAAALIMDHIIDSFSQIYPEPPNFIGIFVDDSIFVLQSDMTDTALEVLNNCVPIFLIHPHTKGSIKFTCSLKANIQ